MTDDEHRLFYKFMKMKPPLFQGTTLKDAFEFLIGFCECLHKMGVVERYHVKFELFYLQAKAKLYCRFFIDCQAALPPFILA